MPSQRDRCHIYREHAAWSPNFTKEQYPTAGKHGCPEYPFDTFPWSN